MPRALAYALCGVLALVAAVAGFAPATLLDAPLALHTQQRLRLADARGFWWHGRGILASADGSARVPIGWRVELVPLARATLVVHLDDAVDPAAPQGTLTLSRQRIDLRDLHLRAPAALAAALDPRLQAVAIGGTLTVDAPTFTARGDAREGSANGRWDRARVVIGETVVDLGTVTLGASSTNHALTGTLRNAGGDLALDGTLATHAGGVEVALVLRPAAGAPEPVRRMLSLLGPPDAAGGVRVAWRSDR